jgi:hypothetical protein
MEFKFKLATSRSMMWLCTLHSHTNTDLLMTEASVSLDTIDDDTLIYVFAFLSVPDILAMRQVS